MFHNRVLRKILGSKRNKVTGDSRRRYNERLHEMCYSLKHYSVDQIKNEVGDASGTHEGKERCIQGFGGETKRKEITCKIYAQIEGYYNDQNYLLTRNSARWRLLVSRFL